MSTSLENDSNVISLIPLYKDIPVEALWAFEEGRMSFFEGWPIKDNPFTPNTMTFHSWNKGYIEAYNEHRKEREH